DNGWPLALCYGVGASKRTIPLDDGQALHLKLFHPLDDHYGMGCLAVAAGPIAIHNAAARWNKALLDNAARPSGALVYEPADGSALSAEAQFERLKTELEEGYTGAAKA
ncbi:phage portal protein, partial [Escherichia coli]|nr:phage portal protein [Escherichia coli]